MKIHEYANYANMITCIFDHGMKDLCLSFNLVQRGTYIYAHAWIFFKLRILITHYIQTIKKDLSNKIVKNTA